MGISILLMMIFSPAGTQTNLCGSLSRSLQRAVSRRIRMRRHQIFRMRQIRIPVWMTCLGD